ncbi:MAG: hypothetical protein ACLVCH_06980 [Roseburia inulinivorans]
MRRRLMNSVIKPVVPVGENMPEQDFGAKIADECNGTQRETDGTFLFTLENSGTNNWDVQVCPAESHIDPGK